MKSVRPSPSLFLSDRNARMFARFIYRVNSRQFSSEGSNRLPTSAVVVVTFIIIVFNILNKMENQKQKKMEKIFLLFSNLMWLPVSLKATVDGLDWLPLHNSASK